MPTIGKRPNGLALMYMAAMAGQWAHVSVILRECRPPAETEGNQREDVGEKARGLRRINPKLALMAGDGDVGEFGVRLAEFLQLPNARWAASGHSAEVLRVLDDCHTPTPPPLSILASRDCPDAKVDELVPLTSMPLHPLELHVGDAPRVAPVPDGRRTILVGPTRARPGGAWRGEHNDVVLAAANAGQDGFPGL